MASMGEIIFTSMIILIIIFATLIILILALSLGGSASSPPPAAQSDNKWPVAQLGRDVLLSCYLPERPRGGVSVTWSRAGLSAPVYRFQRGSALLQDQDPAYQDRTQVFHDDAVRGNVSLVLRRVRLSDAGVYTCSVDTEGEGGGSSSLEVELRVGAFSSPSFSYSSGVLTATALRWLPKPNVTWLDSNGTVLISSNTSYTLHPAASGVYSLLSTLTATPDNTYTCRINNTMVVMVGEATIHHDGEVSGRTFLTYGCASAPVTSKHTAMLTCLFVTVMYNI